MLGQALVGGRFKQLYDSERDAYNEQNLQARRAAALYERVFRELAEVV
jgi:hypothetical protein